MALDPASSAVTLSFIAIGSMDDLEVHYAVRAMAPITYLGMFFQSYSIDHLGGGVWDIEIAYSPLLPKGEPTYTFKTAGGTQHITHSRQTIASYSWVPTQPTPPDYEGAIGVNGENVEGCDIHLPQFTFSETRYIPYALMTTAYKSILFRATGKTNNNPWREFDYGEVLFLGVQGSIRGGRVTDFWELTFEFAASESRFVPIGRTGNILYKLGWEYIWTRYADKVHDPSKSLVRVPVASFIERVYDEFDFTLLGIGV